MTRVQPPPTKPIQGKILRPSDVLSRPAPRFHDDRALKKEFGFTQPSAENQYIDTAPLDEQTNTNDDTHTPKAIGQDRTHDSAETHSTGGRPAA